MLCILMIGTWFLLDKAIDKVIHNNAKITAISWVKHFNTHIEGLIKNNISNQQQVTITDKDLRFGNVFMFKIFRPDGTVLIASDNYQVTNDSHIIKKNPLWL